MSKPAKPIAKPATHLNQDNTVERYLVGDSGEPQRIAVTLSQSGTKAFCRGGCVSRRQLVEYDAVALGITPQDALEKSAKVYRAWIVTDSWSARGEVKQVFLRLSRGRVRVWHLDGHEDRYGLTMNGRDRVFVRQADALQAAREMAASNHADRVKAVTESRKRLAIIDKDLRKLARRRPEPKPTKDVHGWMVDKTETAKALAAAKAPKKETVVA